MPLYRKLSTSRKHDGQDLLDGYEMVLDNATNEWKYTHRLVDDACCDHTIGKARVVHHKDFNKRNNDPTNLVEMTWVEHRKFHGQNVKETLLRPDVIAKREPVRIAALKGEKHRESKRQRMLKWHADPNSKLRQWIDSDAFKQHVVVSNDKKWDSDTYRDKFTGDNNWKRKAFEHCDLSWLVMFCKDNGVTSIKQFLRNNRRTVMDRSPVGMRFVQGLIERHGYDTWRNFAKVELNVDVYLLFYRVCALLFRPDFVYSLLSLSFLANFFRKSI